jgi:hypothetical protein
MIQLLEDKPTQIKIISINFMSMVSPIIDAWIEFTVNSFKHEILLSSSLKDIGN